MAMAHNLLVEQLLLNNNSSMKKKNHWLFISIIILSTASAIIIFFYSLNTLYQTAGHTTATTIIPGNQTKSELIILHANVPSVIKRFQLTVVVLSHQLTDTTLDSTLTVTDQSGAQIGTAHFTALGQTVLIPGYSLSLANATATAIQVVITKLEP